MFIPLCLTCRRDGEIAALMLRSLKCALGDNMGPPVVVFDTTESKEGGAPDEISLETMKKLGARFLHRPSGWGNGGNWAGAAMKAEIVCQVVQRGFLGPRDDLMCVDSDVLFLNDEFTHFMSVQPVSHNAIAGVQHRGDPVNSSRLGAFRHMGGALLVLTHEAAKNITLHWDNIRAETFDELMHDGLPCNEDFVLSFLARRFGADMVDIGDYQIKDVTRSESGSFWHYNLTPQAGWYITAFGVPAGVCQYKWEFARALRDAGKDRWQIP